MKYFDQQQIQDDKDFRMILLKEIPYFHKLYAKYKKPLWLDMARTFGDHANHLKRSIETAELTPHNRLNRIGDNPSKQ